MLIYVYIILLFLGAKATWELVMSFMPTDFDGIGIVIVIFVIAFLIIGPIMGIVASGKFIYSKSQRLRILVDKYLLGKITHWVI